MDTRLFFFPLKESLKQERSNIEGIIKPCDTFIFELCPAARSGPIRTDLGQSSSHPCSKMFRVCVECVLNTFHEL